MKLRLTPEAAAELDHILTYISARSPGGARRVKARLQATFKAIASNPGLGRRTSNKRLRRIGATPYPYLVFYEWTADEIIVIGVRHGARTDEIKLRSQHCASRQAHRGRSVPSTAARRRTRSRPARRSTC